MRIAVLQHPSNPDDEDRRVALQDRRLTLLARKVRIQVENLLRVQEGDLFRQVREIRVLQRGKQFLREFLSSDDHLPDFVDYALQEIEIALLGCDDALPVPLVDVRAV